MQKTKEKNWHNITISQCFKSLKSSKSGLSDKSAKQRIKKYGKNKLPSGKPLTRLQILFNQIKSPLVYVLIIAGTISVFLNHITDAIVILIAVVVNSLFGFWQENKANKAIEHLKKIVKQETIVLRDGRKVQIDSTNLVPGDIIFLKAGDKVPADARVIEQNDIEVIEATLTGESVGSSKKVGVMNIGAPLAERENMFYMGTLISRGQAKALVVSTGLNTEIGKITSLIKEAKEEQTPLQRQLGKMTSIITFFIVLICAIIFAIGVFEKQDPVDIFITVIALAVAAIPEGLVVAVTIILTFGTRFILKKKALVRKLVAAETLGSTSIICTDKTGTLTEGKMQVFKIITADKEYDIKTHSDSEKLEKVQDLISKISILCSSATIENPEQGLENLRIIGDSTEKALMVAAIESGFNKDELDKEYLRMAEIPFDSEKKYMATIHQHKDESHSHVFVKGAPEKIFQFSKMVLMGGKKQKMTPTQLEYLKKKYERLTKKGLRLLAFAYKTGNNFGDINDELNDLVFLGFIALKDPLRKEAREAIKMTQQAGIRTIVITGDHKLTAKAVFSELMPKKEFKIVEGQEMDNWSDAEMKEKVVDIDIYARVEPKHKLRVVNAWKARGEVVAMTGDGVNDAPALKTADIGIAMANGSDVTKETADLILLDNNFNVIVSAVEQGRIIFDNIRKVVVYLLADSFSEMVLIAASMLMGLPIPILATQILWINLVNDGLPNIAMSVEPGEKGIMNLPPRKKIEPIINKEMKILIFIIGAITDFILVILFVALLKLSSDIDYIRTIIFAVLGLDSLLYAFSVRSLHHSIFTENPLKNKYLLLAVGVSFFFLLLAIYLPLLQIVFHTTNIGVREWLLVFALGVFNILMIEAVKHHFIVKEKQLILKNKLKNV